MSSTSEQIAAALARAQPKTFAATDDPHRYEQTVGAEQAAHRARLARRPTDVTREVLHAETVVAARQADLDSARDRLAHWQDQQHATAGLRAFTPSRRQAQRTAQQRVEHATVAVARAEHDLAAAQRQHDQLTGRQAAVVAFDAANAWRHQRIDTLEQRLADHWADAVVAAARDGHPIAYGPTRLRAARRTLLQHVDTLNTTPSAGGTQAPVAGIGDPLRSLSDLDQAITEAAHRPTPALAERLGPAPSAAPRPSRVQPAYRSPAREPPAPMPPVISM